MLININLVFRKVFVDILQITCADFYITIPNACLDNPHHKGEDNILLFHHRG